MLQSVQVQVLQTLLLGIQTGKVTMTPAFRQRMQQFVIDHPECVAAIKPPAAHVDDEAHTTEVLPFEREDTGLSPLAGSG